MSFKIVENDKTRILRSEDYNYVYTKDTNKLLRWGKDTQDVPKFNPHGPEEVCFKVYSLKEEPSGKITCTYLSFDIFQQIFQKLPKTVARINFVSDNTSLNQFKNPDFQKILKACSNKIRVCEIGVSNFAKDPENLSFSLHIEEHGYAIFEIEGKPNYKSITKLENFNADFWNHRVMNYIREVLITEEAK